MIEIWTLAALSVIAAVPAGLRWLRIAQREHYIPPSVTRFAWRWWMVGSANPLLLLVALVGVVGSLWDPRSGILVVVAQFGPVGLSVKGVTSPLGWTPRLRRLALLSGTLVIAAIVIGAVSTAPVIIAGALLAIPVLIDFALVLLSPVEAWLGESWVEKASSKLEEIGPEVVAITGSYGKTTTKNYVAHLVGVSRRTVASPASFNNRMGLARAINENLLPGTEVFVAEMGTYGPGEIAALCARFPPNVAALVAIGPVHLERFKTEERIVAAKAEILDRADVGVICVDHPLLDQLAEDRSRVMPIIEVSAARDVVSIDGDEVTSVPEGVFGANLAVAMGIGKALDVDVEGMRARIRDLPGPEHRLSVGSSASGVTVIDDTFNSNPAGARAALEMLQRLGGDGRTAVVTPGMVELGAVQRAENEAFARDAAGIADDLIIVGMTNRRALIRGAQQGPAAVTVVGSLGEAVEWVRGNLVEGDAVLYENDLPDHYP